MLKGDWIIEPLEFVEANWKLDHFYEQWPSFLVSDGNKLEPNLHAPDIEW